MTPPNTETQSKSDSQLARVLDEYLAALQAGNPPTKADMLADLLHWTDLSVSCLCLVYCRHLRHGIPSFFPQNYLYCHLFIFPQNCINCEIHDSNLPKTRETLNLQMKYNISCIVIVKRETIQWKLHSNMRYE